MVKYIEKYAWKVSFLTEIYSYKNRTDNDIKNRFYSTLRRSLRRISKLIGDKNS